jgi:ubiquinone/menaquinone biosynthesis C-methylase UbiE
MEMEVISTFDRNAEDYDRWYSEKSGKLVFESEVRAIGSLDFGGFGVEVGIGTGAFSLRLDVPLGLDPALKMIEIAKRQGVDVVRAIGESLPIKNNCLDYVLFAFTICFLRSLQDSLREAWRVLRPGGNVIVGFISHSSEWGELYSKKKVEGHRFYRYAKFHTVEEVEEALGHADFKIQKCLGTLSQKHGAVTAIEEPSSDVSQSGFVCIKAMKM